MPDQNENGEERQDAVTADDINPEELSEEERELYEQALAEEEERLEEEARQERIAEAARAEARSDNLEQRAVHGESPAEGEDEAEEVRDPSGSLVVARSFGPKPHLWTHRDLRSAEREAARELKALGIPHESTRDLSGTASIEPTGFMSKVVEAAAELSPLASGQFVDANQMTRDVQDFPVMGTRGSANRLPVGRGQDMENHGNHAGFSKVSLEAHKFGDVLPIEEELLENSAINLRDRLVRLFAEYITEMQEWHYFNGDTAQDQPEGVLQNGAVPSVDLSTAADDPALIEAVEGMYFQILRYARSGSAAWFTTPLGMKRLNNLRNADGDKLLGNHSQDEPFQRLMGLPIFPTFGIEDTDVEPDGTVDETTLVLGDWRKYVVGIRSRLEISSSAHAGFETDEVKLKYRTRYDAKVGLAEAFIVGNGLQL